MASVVVMTSGKGGVGKSSVSVGVAVALANSGKRVLMIDGDNGLRCLDFLLGVTQELVYDISDVVAGNCTPLKAIYPCSYCHGLYVLPAPLIHDYIVSGEVMTKLVDILGRYFDIIILDSPAGLGHGFISAVIPADFVFVVATADPVSVRDIIRVKEKLNELNKNKIRLIINKFDLKAFRNQKAFENIDKLIDETTVQLLGIVPYDIEIQNAASAGIPLDKVCKASKAFARIAGRMEGQHLPLVLD